MITEEGHRSIRALLDRKLATQADMDALEAAERKGYFNETLPSMTVSNGIATIPIHGILARGVSPIEKSCGVTDYNDIETDILEARNDQTVEAILLDIDSPGGAVNGLFEVAEEVLTTRDMKPIVAFTAGQMCSAAYFLGCCASAICAAPSSSVGSIGVILQVLDETKRLESLGYKVETFTSDPLKGTGARGTSLTDAQKEYLQSMVNEAAGHFKTHVRNNRRKVEESSMDGRVFTAESAKRLGLVDRVVRSISDAAAMLK